MNNATVEAAHAMLPRLVASLTEYSIFLIGIAGEILTWNAGAASALGYKSSEVVGRDFEMLFTEEERSSDASRALLREVAAKGKHEGYGTRVRRDGSSFWCNFRMEAIRDAAGGLSGFATVIRNAPQHFDAEAEAGSQEPSFGMLVQSVTDYAIYMLDVSGNVVSWNAGAERLKGYAASNIIGHHFSQFYTEADRQSELPSRALATALETGRFEGEGPRVRADGSTFWASVVVQPIRDKNDTLVGFAKITRDLTPQKQQQDLLDETRCNLSLALENMSQGLCLFDEEDRVVLSNFRMRDVLQIGEYD